MPFVETSEEIEVSSLMKHFRHQEHTHSQEYVARQLAENWGEVKRGRELALCGRPFDNSSIPFR